MLWADLCAAIILLAILAYAVLGGADYGGGVLDLFARGDRAAAQRTAIAKSMGPVWEANHVWLVFVLVGLFTAFPVAYQALAVVMYLPLLLALIGIVARGVAFAFRGYVEGETVAYGRFSRVFGIASVITPFLFGAVAGGLGAAERSDIVLEGGRVVPGGLLDAWTGPFSLVTGVLALTICAYLAATFMTVDLQRGGQLGLIADFRLRALVAGALAGVFSVGGLVAASVDAPTLYARLTGEALPLLLAGVLAGAGSMGAMWWRRYAWARGLVVAAVVSVVTGWGLAQYPRLIGPEITIREAAATESMLIAFFITALIGLAVMLPCLYLLFVSFRRKPWAVPRS